jgi:ADP-glucose pyrophosphorylase
MTFARDRIAHPIIAYKRSTRARDPCPSGSVVKDSIVLDNCIIGRQCRIRRTIVDENVTLADGVNVGYDLEQDRARHHVTDTGIVVVTSRSGNRMIVDSRAAGTAV